MIVKEVLDKTVRFFRDKKIESPRLDAELLIAAALGLKRIDLYLKFDQPLKDEEVTRCRDHVRRRSSGEPVAYILGTKEFFGESFLVSPDVLIPRPETELLVEAAIKWAQEQQSDSLQILDLGCGSGCLGLSVAQKILNSKVTLVDISESALSVAKKNVEKLGLSERATLVLSDAAIFNSEEKFDLILANPPYIDPKDARVESNVRQFEPHLALFAGNKGLEKIFSWSQNIKRFAQPKSFVGFEIGCDQGQEVLTHFFSLGFLNAKILKDYSDLDRHVVAIEG